MPVENKEDTQGNVEELLKKAKMKCRNGRAALTRLGKVIIVQMYGNFSNEEIKKAMENYEWAFSDLETKHKQVTLLVEDDEKFAEEEQWIEQCQETFLHLKIEAQDYMKRQTISEKKLDNIQTVTVTKSDENLPTEFQSTEIPVSNENEVTPPNEESEDISEIPPPVLVKKRKIIMYKPARLQMAVIH